jgi:hypothetical protein
MKIPYGFRWKARKSGQVFFQASRREIAVFLVRLEPDEMAPDR